MAQLEPALQAEVGYAMHRLGAGEPILDVQEIVRARLATNDMNVGLAGAIVNQALGNLQARELVANAPMSQPFILSLPVSQTTQGQIGLRVLLPIKFPDGHTETIGVVVNVQPGDTPERALEQALRLARLYQTTRYGGRYAQGTVGAGQIVQVFAGGLQSGESI